MAQDISVSPQDTNDNVAAKMLVALEQRATLVQMMENGEGSQGELRKQLAWKDEEIAHIEEISKLKDEKIQLYQEREKLYQEKEKVYQEKDKTNQSLSDMKDKACTEQIKAATPTFMDNMTKYFTGAGVGGALAVIAIILL